MAQILEMLMVISFGCAWPASIIKSYRARSAKGKSLSFLCIIELGYIFGILAKIIGNNVNYVLVFYVINLLMVGADLVLYFRNTRLDRQREQEHGESGLTK